MGNICNLIDIMTAPAFSVVFYSVNTGDVLEVLIKLRRLECGKDHKSQQTAN